MHYTIYSASIKKRFQQLFRQIGRGWALTIEAIKGGDLDYTSMRIRKAITLLAIPMVFEMIMESIFAVADIFFVAKLGSEAVAAVGITESLMTIVYAVGFGLSMGTTAIVSRRIGEKNIEGANTAAVQAILGGLAASALLAIPGIFFAEDLLRLMGASESLISDHSSYTKLMISMNAVIMFLFIINAIFRSAGNAAISMRVLFLANGINIILDPLLIFGLGPIPAMGVKGAAIATITGRGIAVLYQFYLLFGGYSKIKITLASLKPEFMVLINLFRLSAGGIGQNLIATASWVVMVRLVSGFGSEAVAGYTIAIRIIIFSLLPAWGISNAAATLVGQNLGAKQPKRAETSAWITGITNMFLMGGISLVLIIIPESLISIFTTDAAVIEYGVNGLRIISYGFVFYGLGMVMTQALNGAGDTFTPTLLNFIAFWMIEIPLAYALSHYTDLASNGIFMAIVLAESVLAILGMWVFWRGKWKTVKV